MEEFDDGQLDWEYTDVPLLTRNFLSKLDLLSYVKWSYDNSVVNLIKEFDLDRTGTLDLVESFVESIEDMTKDLIEYNLYFENYELIPQIKERCQKLCKEALELEMKVERFL
mgnify:CR=1 FL=1